LLTLIILHASVGARAQENFASPRYAGGELPAVSPMVVAGGQVFLEVLVADDGRVSSIRTLRTTPGFTDAVLAAVRRWRFVPASARGPVAAPVFVAAMFTPPALDGPTLGQPPRDVASASDRTPLVISSTPAVYPPRATGTGAVLVEVTIAAADVVADVRVVVSSSPAFDAAALAAARSWQFAKARRDGNVVATRAYLLFGFQQPVFSR
jgi:TonB family protein